MIISLPFPQTPPRYSLCLYPINFLYPLPPERKRKEGKPQKSKQTNSIKQTSKTPNSTETKKKAGNKHGVYFVLVIYSRAWGLSWSVVEIPSINLLYKTDFPNFSSFQSQIVPCKVWDFVSYCLIHAGILSGFNLSFNVNTAIFSFDSYHIL